MGEIPHLQAAGSRLKDQPFEILNVSLDDSRREVAMFVQAVKFPGIHTWNEKARDNPIAELYHAQSLPTWYLIGPDGRIREKDPFDDRLIPAVERALATSGPPTGTRGE